MSSSPVLLRTHAGRARAAVSSGVRSAGPWLQQRPLILVPALAGGAVSWLYERFYAVVIDCQRLGTWPAGGCAAPTLPLHTLQRGGVSAAELTTRLTWNASVLLLTTVALGAVFVGVSVVLRASRGEHPAARGVLLLAGVLAGFLDMGHGAARATHFIVFQELLANPALFSGDERAFVTSMAVGMRGFTLFAACVLVVAACATLLPPRSRSVEGEARELKLQMTRLNLVLYTGAALLVAAVLEFGALEAWGLSRLTEASARLFAPATSAAVAATAGVAFLVLIALYLPALLILHIRGEDLFDRTPRATPPITRDAWLQTHGLAVTMPTYVTRFAAVLAPLLAAGPFSALLRIVLGI